MHFVISILIQDAILTAYQEAIPKVHTPGYPGTAAQLLEEVTGIVMQEHPDMVVVSVNDDRKLSAPPEYTLITRVSRS